MKNKLFTTIFYSSIILLTACGGGSDGSSNGTSTQGKEKIDYTKAESIESIYEPIISLSQENDNIALIGTEFAENIYYGIYAGNNFRCSKGSFTKNSDKSITFNRLLAKIKKRSTFCLFFIHIKKSCSTIMST